MLGHLNSFGDCLYATTVARQIKKDYPGCYLTWAIGSMCKQILDGNPYVDEIWEIHLASIEEIADTWPRFEMEAYRRKKNGDFDEIYLTQIAPGNLQNYDGTIRSSIFRAYPKAITVPVTPVLRLSDTEIDNVRRFVETHHFSDKTQVILFESSPKSAQSDITPEFALMFARKLLELFPDVYIIISSNSPLQTMSDHILDGSVLTLRENAELTKYCSLMIGGSSGISWIATSDWAKPLPMIQLIKAKTIWFASFVHDHEFFGLATDKLIEMADCNVDKLLACVRIVFTDGFSRARLQFHERIPIPFLYFEAIQTHLLQSCRYLDMLKFTVRNVQRHGLKYEFVVGTLMRLLRYGLLIPCNIGILIIRKLRIIDQE